MVRARRSSHSAGALVDRIEILELSARYAHTGNEHDADGHAATFAPDGILETLDGAGKTIDGWVFQGRDAIRDLVLSQPAGPFEITGDPIIELSGDTATQIASFLFGVRDPHTKSFRIVTSGRYRDALVRTAEGWRFARRSVSLDIGIEEFVQAIAQITTR